jgi:hypothetical protein
MRVMQIIWRSNRDIIQPLTAPTKLIDMPVKPLKFGKKMRVWEMAIQNTNRIVGIKRNHKLPARVLNRLHVARRNVTGSSDKGIGLQGDILRDKSKRGVFL